MRIGIDSDHETYLEAATSAANLGVAWVALHARTAQQMYEGKADWSAITRLVEHLKPTGVPVLGNGDIIRLPALYREFGFSLPIIQSVVEDGSPRY